MVACGASHTLFLTRGMLLKFYVLKVEDGESLNTYVYATGDGSLGQLGLGTPERERKEAVPEPQQISTLANKHIVNIVAGDNHSMAMDITGQLWTWGCNKYGQVRVTQFIT